MKRTMYVFGVLVMLVAVLAACGAPAAPAPQAPAAAATEAAAPAEEATEAAAPAAEATEAAAAPAEGAKAPGDMNFVTVVKIAGIDWFNRMEVGVKEFGTETGIKASLVGPDTADAAKQIPMIEDLIALARARGWSRLYWHTQAGNVPARRLYDSFVRADDFVRYRLFLR